MNNPFVALVAVGLAVIATLASVQPATASAFEVDASGQVTRVVDGDTIDVSGVGRVRLADIDAPEWGYPGFDEAFQYATSLVLSRTVYLDIDDVYGQDRYDRRVAVVYVRHNATHLLNLNEALLEAGLAEVSNYNNEFSPYTWTLYVYSLASPPPPAGNNGGDYRPPTGQGQGPGTEQNPGTGNARDASPASSLNPLPYLALVIVSALILLAVVLGLRSMRGR